jgi:hypothetical protein
MLFFLLAVLAHAVVPCLDTVLESNIEGKTVLFQAASTNNRSTRLAMPVVAKVIKVMGQAPHFYYSVQLKDGTDDIVTLGNIQSSEDLLNSRQIVEEETLSTPLYTEALANSHCPLAGVHTQIQIQKFYKGRLQTISISGKITRIRQEKHSRDYLVSFVPDVEIIGYDLTRPIQITEEEYKRLRQLHP